MPLLSCTYLKGWTDKLFLKGILEQYRPALEILGLLHEADGGGIIHRQTSRSESESLSLLLGLLVVAEEATSLSLHGDILLFRH